MPGQINFTLKFAYDYKNQKARMTMDFTPEFSSTLDGRTTIQAFNPKRLREALRFVEVGVIRRIVEHLKREELKKQNQGHWGRRAKALQDMKHALEQIDTLKASIKSGGKKTASRNSTLREIGQWKKAAITNSNNLDKFDELIKPRVEEMIRDWENQPDWEGDEELKLTTIGFEQMSAALPTYSVQRVANTDVPPPKPKL